MTRFRCVDDQKAAGFPVTAACEAAGVSTSGFYDWCNREAAGPTERQAVEAELVAFVSTSGFYDWAHREAAGPTERQAVEAELVALMREIFDAADGNYGVPRMHTELRRAGLVVNEKRCGA